MTEEAKTFVATLVYRPPTEIDPSSCLGKKYEKCKEAIKDTYTLKFDDETNKFVRCK